MLDISEIIKIIAPGGLLACSLKGYEHRLQQENMIKDVSSAYNNGSVALIEAGTGTGKSLSYILPALLWAAKNFERTVISTNTINLQEQLVFSDIPKLLKALNISLKVALVKGMNNYVCLRNLNEVRYQQIHFTRAEQENIETIYGHIFGEKGLNNSLEGTKNSLPIFPNSQLWEKIGAESETCSHSKCPFYNDCFYFRAKKKAQDAHILVSNHNLLLADLKVRAQMNNYSETAILPRYTKIIVDEAHHLSELATEHFADRVQRLDFNRLFGRLFSEKRGEQKGRIYLLIEKLMRVKNINNLLAPAIIHRFLLDIATLKNHLLESSNKLFDKIAWFVKSMNSYDEVAVLPDYTSLKLRLLPRHYDSFKWKDELAGCFKNMIEAVRSTSAAVFSLQQDLNGVESQQLDELKALRSDVQNLMARLTQVSETLQQFTQIPAQNMVRWIEIQRLNGFYNVEIVDADLLVADKINEYLFDKFSTVVLCSATLSANKSFAFIKKELGLAKDLVASLKIAENIYDSPFDYKKQVLLSVPTDLPAPTDKNFNEAANDFIWQSVQISHGHTFVLFTSYQAMQECREALGHKFKEKNYPLLCQGDLPRRKLVEKFKTTRSSILFGTDSFWEGVDVVGDALRCVIMVKLPFKVPGEPLFQAKTEYISSQGGNPFKDYSIPQAALKFKQGFGRLMRNRWDRGCVICLDNRLINKGYGKNFINSLPDCQQKFASTPEILTEIASFYKKTYHFVLQNPFKYN